MSLFNKHEITDNIPGRESPENSLRNPDNYSDHKLALNTEKQDALFLEVQGLKQNLKPQDTINPQKENNNTSSDKEKALIAKNNRIKKKEAVEV